MDFDKNFVHIRIKSITADFNLYPTKNVSGYVIVKTY